MKNFMRYALMIMLGFLTLAVQAESKDFIVVRQIEKESNLSQSDVDRWSFLWMGRLAQPAAAAGTAYAAYKAGTAGYNLATAIPAVTSVTPSPFGPSSRFPITASKTYGETLVENVFKGEWTPQFIKDTDFNGYEKLLGNKWFWGGVGVAGVIFVSYKMLYPRIEAGIISKIQNLERLCDTLAVTKEAFVDMNALINGMQLKKNITWHANGTIAMELGIDNLIEQCRCALLLIEQLMVAGGSNNAQVDRLNRSITGFNNNLRHNRLIVLPIAERELAVRQEGIAAGRGQQLADLAIKAANAGVTGMYIKNVSDVWKTLKDIAKFGMKHKEEIAGISIVGYGIKKYNDFFGGK